MAVGRDSSSGLTPNLLAVSSIEEDDRVKPPAASSEWLLAVGGSDQGGVMGAISMYDRGSWSSKSDTLPVMVGLVFAVALGLIPLVLLLAVML